MSQKVRQIDGYISTTMLYLLRGRRLPPLIVAHWASDAASALFAALPEDKRTLPGRQRHRKLLAGKV